MSTSTELQETLLKAIDAVVTQRNNELKLDKTITGIIRKNAGKRGNNPLYQVEYGGGVIEAVALNADDIYTPRTSVLVLIPQGDFSREKTIIGRASTIQTDRSASVVAAAVNKYSIVGSNLLEESDHDGPKIKDLQYGLHSFHDKATESEGHSRDHRIQFLYSDSVESNKIRFKDDQFNVYKGETTALMIKADFRTNLDIAQRNKSSAQYGLIFQLVFDNLNKGYGETQGEILDYIAENIITDSFAFGDNNNERYTLSSILSIYFKDDSKWEQESTAITAWTADNTGYIDQAKEYITVLYQNFEQTHPKDNTDIVKNTITAFLNLLSDLKNGMSVEDIKNTYEDWLAEIVGDEEQKTEYFILSSNDMIGNPMNFTTWNTQYAVFEIDLSTFDHLENIIFYKEGFVENSDAESKWPIGVDGGGPDIFVKNLQMYAMNPLDMQSGDYTLNIQPYNGQSNILSNANQSTQFKATLLRKFYEDLTANNAVSYLWFKEDSSIINSESSGYNFYSGAGWRELKPHNEINYLFSTNINNNYAYKNNYKCVAIYEPSADDQTILSYTFSVYNKEKAIDVKLVSDLGTNFSFDAGVPTITALINTNRIQDEEKFEEQLFTTIDSIPKYKYIWSVADNANGFTLFLNEAFSNKSIADMSSIESAMLTDKKDSLSKKIKRYYIDGNEVIQTDDSEKASRIAYPVSNSSSGFTITCYFQEYVPELEGYADIGSYSLEFTNQDSSVISDYRIHIVNGDQVFQYDEYGNTPKAKKKKDPLEVQPLQAKLYTPQGLEVQGTNYQVEWIFPIENTMIIPPAEGLRENPATKLLQSYIGSELSFDIQDLYNPDAYDNQITCHVSFGGKDYYKDTQFFFGKQGSNGTNGTDTVAKIICAKEDQYKTLAYQPLTLYVQKGNDDDTKGRFNVDSRGWSSLDKWKSFLDIAGTNESYLKAVLYQKDKEIASDDYAGTYPRWTLAGNFNGQENGKFLRTTTTTEGSFLTWDYSYTKSRSNKSILYRLQNIRTEVQLTSGQTYYAFYSLPIIEYEPGQDLWDIKTTNRIAIDRTGYLNEIVYNADGRNPVYNHNQGLKLINIPKTITKVTFSAKGGWTNSENKPDFKLLTVEDKKENSSNNKGLTSITLSNLNSEAMVYVIPNDQYDGSHTNNRIEAKLYEKASLVATVYAPINMTLNTFGLASLNAWDGNTVQIDNDNGYVMAPQIGAGEKDSNNRFTGILMGKTETYTGGSDNEKQVGLFGYAHGLQSIFLDSETGNATFGLPDVYSELDENGDVIRDENGNPIRKYQNTNRNSDDDGYGEGRIELRPGGVSKIGGWRIGRCSLYYTTHPTNTDIDAEDYGYQYHGEIGSPYKYDMGTVSNKEYAAHHKKDIETKDGGLLLSADPPYISIKGERLTAGEIDGGLNSQLMEGDSLEIQLDPKTPTLFTIFRHNSEKRTEEDEYGPIAGRRRFLAGINDKGELLANGVGKEDGDGTGTKSGNIILKAFKDTRGDTPGSYVGSVFEAGTGLASTRTFFQIFRSRYKPLDTTSQVYMTGGQNTTSGDFELGDNDVKDEYLRPISIHGQKIMLYAKTGTPEEYVEVGPKKGTHRQEISEDGSIKYIEDAENGNYARAGYDWTETDANIQITTNEGQINLGADTQLHLNRKASATNVLKTTGSFNWNVGIDGDRKKLTINAADLKENYTSIDQNVTSNINITNKGNYVLNTKNSTKTIELKLQQETTDENNVTTTTDLSYLTIANKNVELGIPDVNNAKSLITLYTGTSTNKVSSWNLLNQDLKITLDNKGVGDDAVLNGIAPRTLTIGSNGIATGATGRNGTSNPQVMLYAGNLSNVGTGNNQLKSSYTRILLNTSNNNWSNVNGSGSSAIGGDYEVDGIPFMIETKSAPINDEGDQETRQISIRTNVIGNTRLYRFYIGMGTKIIGGLELTDDVAGVSGATGYSLWAAQGIHTQKTPNYISFANCTIDKDGLVNENNTLDGPYTATGTTLAKLIADCLKAAGSAKAAADAAQTAANNAQATANSAVSSIAKLKDDLGTAAYKNVDYFATANHSHSVTIDPKTITALYVPAGRAMKAGDNTVTGWTQTIHTLSATLT